MEKPTKSAPVVTSPAGFGPFQTLIEAPHQAPGDPLDSPPDKPSSFSKWRPLSGAVSLHAQLIEHHRLREDLRRIERLEEALFPGRRRKP